MSGNEAEGDTNSKAYTTALRLGELDEHRGKYGAFVDGQFQGADLDRASLVSKLSPELLGQGALILYIPLKEEPERREVSIPDWALGKSE